jgi:hypothetical protein
MKLTATVLAAGLLAASSALYAQAPKADAPHPHHKGVDCAQAKDPKACEERHAKMKERMKERHESRNAAFDKSYDACKGKATGAEFRACMRDQNPRGKK